MYLQLSGLRANEAKYQYSGTSSLFNPPPFLRSLPKLDNSYYNIEPAIYTIVYSFK